mmetsp:Transcript_23828/g.94471  ORF Transcript_23828/g.94471 Transcript_23828/m.94471 type:complete len:83 (-) Transcript_23828:397-645(-)
MEICPSLETHTQHKERTRYRGGDPDVRDTRDGDYKQNSATIRSQLAEQNGHLFGLGFGEVEEREVVLGEVREIRDALRAEFE